MKKTNSVWALIMAALFLGGCQEAGGFLDFFSTSWANGLKLDRPSITIDPGDSRQIENLLNETKGDQEASAALLGAIADAASGVLKGGGDDDEKKAALQNLLPAAFTSSYYASNLGTAIVSGAAEAIEDVIKLLQTDTSAGSDNPLDLLDDFLKNVASGVSTDVIAHNFISIFCEDDGTADGPTDGPTRISKTAIDALIDSETNPDEVALGAITLLLAGLGQRDDESGEIKIDIEGFINERFGDLGDFLAAVSGEDYESAYQVISDIPDGDPPDGVLPLELKVSFALMAAVSEMGGGSLSGLLDGILSGAGST